MATRPFTIARTDHVGFAVTSLDDAIRFWVEGLGGTVLRTGTMGGDFLAQVTGARGAGVRMAVVEIAGQRIELLEYRGAPARRGPTPAPYHPGAAHLALLVDDLDAALERMAAYGWQAQGVPQTIASGARAGTRVMYVVGPDGAALELMQPPA